MTHFYRFCVFVVGTFLSLPVTTYADGCRVVYQPTHAVQNYAPTVGYDYYAKKAFAVPFVQIPTTFYQVAPELTQLRISQVMIEEATKKALNEFKADLAKQQLPPLPQERVPLGPSPVSDTTDPLANLVESIPRASLGTTNVQQVFNTHCVKCHGAGDTVNLTNAAAYPASKREKLLACVEHDAGEKAMPPKTKLPPEVLRQVRRWAFDK